MTHIEATLFNVTLSSFQSTQEKLININAYADIFGQLCELSPNAERLSLEKLEVIFKDIAKSSDDAHALLTDAIEGINVYIESKAKEPYTDKPQENDLRHELAKAGYVHLPDYKIIRMTETGDTGNSRYLVPINAHKKKKETQNAFIRRVGVLLDK